MAATAFTVSVAPSGGDYTNLQAAVSSCTCDLTTSATLVFAHSAITGTMSDNAGVTGLTSGATGTCRRCTATQILISGISGTFQSGEVVYETLSVNLVTINDAGNNAYVDLNINGSWSSADTTAVVITGYTTNATNYLNIRTSGTATNTTGIYSETGNYYFLKVSTATSSGAIDIQNACVNITGLQIYNTAPANSSESAIRDHSGSTAGIVNITQCILRVAGRYALRMEPAVGTTFNVYNTIAYGALVGGAVFNALSGDSIANIYNSNFIGLAGSQYGFRQQGTNTTLLLENCYAHNATVGADYTVVASRSTITTCASSDATGSVGLTSVSYSTVNFSNVTAGSENYNLVSGSQLILGGTNLSGTFTNDIIGATRQASGAWDVGAFYFNSGTAGTSVLGIMNLKTGWWGDL